MLSQAVVFRKFKNITSSNGMLMPPPPRGQVLKSEKVKKCLPSRVQLTLVCAHATRGQECLPSRVRTVRKEKFNIC